MLSSISVGAVGAAFIAALVSVLGLIISKENKVSEFRQAWIDALRMEITTYLGSINLICDALQVRYVDQKSKVEALSRHYSSLNTATFMITLRLNSEEENAKKILSCMQDFKILLSSEIDVTPENIRKIEVQLLNSSKLLLKNEWNRVKKGEPTFFIAKYFALVFIIVILIGAFIRWPEISDALPDYYENDEIRHTISDSESDSLD